MADNLNSIPQSVLTPDQQTTTGINPVESPAVAVVPVQPVKDTKLDSTRWAHLSKKEAALVKERESLKKERELFSKEKEESAKHRKAWEMVNEIADLQKTDAVAAMKRAGFSDTDMMNFLAQSQDTSTPEEKAVKLAKSEIEKFKSEQAVAQSAKEKQLADQKKIDDDRTIAKFKSNIGVHIKSTADKHEYCNFYGESAQELIYETISSILAESNEMIGIEEATQLVEDFYEEQDKAMSSLKKRAPKVVEVTKTPVISPKGSATTRVESKQFIDNRTPTKTLSSKITPTLSNSVPENMTPEQNKQYIIEKFANSLKR